MCRYTALFLTGKCVFQSFPDHREHVLSGRTDLWKHLKKWKKEYDPGFRSEDSNLPGRTGHWPVKEALP